MNKSSFLVVTTIRICITAWWIALIIGFLLLPKLNVFFSNKQSISILAWPTLLDANKLAEFEKKTGIKVYVSYFENNQELYAKIKETKGVGYDLIMPSDYMIQPMIQQGLIKKIDKTKLTFFNKLYPHLIGNYYDAHNEYSIPYFWSIYGIAYNKNHFNAPPKPSWSLIFDPTIGQRHMSMIDDAREAVLIASQYLFGKQQSLQNEQLQEIKKLLVAQKKIVEVYTEDRANFLLASESVSVAVILQAVVARIMKTFENISFVIPSEGSFLVIDSFAMPQKTTKDELVYQFLNYVYQPEVLSYYNQKFGYFTPIEVSTKSSLPMPSTEQLKKADFFRNIIDFSTISNIWIAVKA